VTQPGPAAGPPPITIGGIAPEKRLVTAVHDLAARVVTRLTEQIPVYASLPAEQLRGDITAITVRGIRGFAQALRTGEPPTAAQLELMHRSAARRAEERIPLDAVVGAYFLGAHECLGHVLADAGPDDLADVLAAQRLLLRYLNAVTESVFAGYIAESQAALGEQQSARQALLSALLDGGPARQAAERAGLRLPAAYWVVSLAAAAHPDEHTQGVDPAIAAGRKLRRMRAELDRQAHGAVLSALSPDGGLVLVPAAAGPDDLTDADWERLTALVRHVERASGAELTAAAAAAPPQDVPAAARLAAQVRQVAGGCGRGPGLYRLEDVLLEYQLTLPGPRPAGRPAGAAGRPRRPARHPADVPGDGSGPPPYRRAAAHPSEHRRLPAAQGHRADRPERHARPGPAEDPGRAGGTRRVVQPLLEPRDRPAMNCRWRQR
jgi:hypothetical protein